MNHIVQSKNYAAPIMLFDDALAHYDAKRIDFFYHYMQYNSHNQFFLTNTDFPKDITLYQDITLYDLGKLLNNDSQLLF
ncbi:MAG: recombinational DNA repair ATPase RecF [Alphaproteobacteria bacterium]|jgi:recombinational DNA repair ATPase RecF